VAPTLIQLPGPIVSQEDASLGHQAVAVRFDRKLTECLSYAVIEILLGTERLPMNPALSQPGCPSGSLALRALSRRERLPRRCGLHRYMRRFAVSLGLQRGSNGLQGRARRLQLPHPELPLLLRDWLTNSAALCPAKSQILVFTNMMEQRQRRLVKIRSARLRPGRARPVYRNRV
jgi:hypothetical protein